MEEGVSFGSAFLCFDRGEACMFWQLTDFNCMQVTRTRPAKANWLLHVPASRRLCFAQLNGWMDWGIEEASEHALSHSGRDLIRAWRTRLLTADHAGAQWENHRQAPC